MHDALTVGVADGLTHLLEHADDAAELVGRVGAVGERRAAQHGSEAIREDAVAQRPVSAVTALVVALILSAIAASR